MSEYVDDELPLPSFNEIFGDGNSNKKRKKGGVQEVSGEESTGRWTSEEHRLFLEGIMLYGKDWKKMQPLIKTRTLVQIRTHAQKVFKKIGLKKITSSAELRSKISSLPSEEYDEDYNKSASPRESQTNFASNNSNNNQISASSRIGVPQSISNHELLQQHHQQSIKNSTLYSMLPIDVANMEPFSMIASNNDLQNNSNHNNHRTIESANVSNMFRNHNPNTSRMLHSNSREDGTDALLNAFHYRNNADHNAIVQSQYSIYNPNNNHQSNDSRANMNIYDNSHSSLTGLNNLHGQSSMVPYINSNNDMLTHYSRDHDFHNNSDNPYLSLNGLADLADSTIMSEVDKLAHGNINIHTNGDGNNPTNNLNNPYNYPIQRSSQGYQQ
eukprot:gene4877-6833_t